MYVLVLSRANRRIQDDHWTITKNNCTVHYVQIQALERDSNGRYGSNIDTAGPPLTPHVERGCYRSPRGCRCVLPEADEKGRYALAKPQTVGLTR